MTYSDTMTKAQATTYFNALADTIETLMRTYRTDTRSLNENGECQYQGETLAGHPAMCAVGSMLTPYALEYWHTRELEVGAFGVTTAFNRMGDVFNEDTNVWLRTQLKADYHGITINQLSRLQSLHDNAGYWNKDTRQLNEAGENLLKDILRSIRNLHVTYPKAKVNFNP